MTAFNLQVSAKLGAPHSTQHVNNASLPDECQGHPVAMMKITL